jgi:hypothetical protein
VVAAGAAPLALACSDAHLFEDVACAEDTCAPGLCEVTRCAPRSGSSGICSAAPGPDNVVYAIGDSPGAVCCMALPHTSGTPTGYRVLSGPRNTAESNYACATFTQAQQWQQVEFGGLDSSTIFVVRCISTPMFLIAVIVIVRKCTSSTRPFTCVCLSCVLMPEEPNQHHFEHATCKVFGLASSRSFVRRAHILLVQAHCAANDTQGNKMVDVSSVFLSPPRIIDPMCIARANCATGELIAKLLLSMTVSGRLAYVLLPSDTYNDTLIASLTTEQVFAEALAPSLLLNSMQQSAGAIDASHHGVVDIVQPAVSTQVPVGITNNTDYQLLMAAEYSDATTPCCYDTANNVPQVFPINETMCGEANCCNPAETLRELQPNIRFTDAAALPVGAVTGRVLNSFTYAFEQTFAFVGAAPGAVGAVVANAGGSQLYTSAGAGRQPTSLQVAAPLRPPAVVRAVVQQSTLYAEADSAVGVTPAGRTLYVRCSNLVAVLTSLLLDLVVSSLL